MMTDKDLHVTLGEALRLIDRIEDLLAVYGEVGETAYPLPERAAVKRASLDLTRALAKLRRS